MGKLNDSYTTGTTTDNTSNAGTLYIDLDTILTSSINFIRTS
ncbi:unnamed protein product [marine sediment metagenome]|uniref:Uncharacterized protein n=1 Tax=marine sediment metagenome TaxID=412755 RepID=X1GX09_9ZZZZ